MPKWLLCVAVSASLTGDAVGAMPEKQEFDRLDAELVKTEKQLEALRISEAIVPAADKPRITAAIEEKTRQRERLMNDYLQAALKAYLANPNKDEKINQIMLTTAQKHLEEDRYEEALRHAAALAEKGHPDKRVHELAGIAAFQSNRFDEAEKHLTAAQRAGSLSGTGKRLLQMVSDYKKLWAKEQEIRAAEAKADDLPRVRLETTAGDFTIELFENEAPNTVANFVHLVEKGFYNGLVFHRVIPGFMAQGGDPTGRGSGGPGWAIACECHNDSYRRHFRGTLSMAHAGRDTGGSQFFLTFVPTSHLDGKHTAFGRIIEGEENLARIARRDPGDPGEPTKITRASVLRKRNYEYVPKKLASRR